MERGFTLAFIAIILWAILTSTTRVLVTTYDVNPILFACFSIMGGALTLLAIPGKGRARSLTLTDYRTWGIGIFRFLDMMFFITALVWITATEAEFILGINVIISAILVWVFFNRQPKGLDWLGYGIIFLGSVFLMFSLPGGLSNPAVICLLLGCTSGAIAYVFLEKHPISNQSLGLHARAQFTGVVLLIVGMAFTLFVFSLALLKPHMHIPEENGFWSVVRQIPDAADFNLFAITSSLLLGAVLRGPVMYIVFLAVRLLKQDTYYLTARFIPFGVLGMESLYAGLGLLQFSTFTPQTLVVGICITLGAMIVLYNRMRR